MNPDQTPARPITPIPVTGLQQTQTPANVPAPAPLTGAGALAGHVDAAQSSTDTFLKGLQKNTESAGAGAGNSLDALLKSLSGTQSQGALTDAAYTGTVDPAQQQLMQVNNQLTAEKLSTQHQIEQLRANPGGLSTDALNNNVQNINQQSLYRQADLAVIQMAAQGQYDSAKAIADRAVQAKFEQEKLQNDTLKYVYEQNKDLFTTAQQRQFQVQQADRDRLLNQKVTQENFKYDEMIKQSSPLYKAQLEQTKAATANTYSEIAARGAAQGKTINGKPQTATQAQVQGYADRTNQSDVILNKIGSKFTGIESYVGANLPNFLKSADRQQYEQAQRDFVNAVLRRESGAAISASEFDNAAKQYFPQPGDTPEVVAQKAANRQTVINNLYQQSNVQRAVLPGQIIEDAQGNQYQVGDDGETLTPVGGGSGGGGF